MIAVAPLSPNLEVSVFERQLTLEVLQDNCDYSLYDPLYGMQSTQEVPSLVALHLQIEYDLFDDAPVDSWLLVAHEPVTDQVAAGARFDAPNTNVHGSLKE